MTQDTNFMTFIRSLLALAGTFIIGHAIGGHAITSQLWDTVIGAALSLTAFITEWKSTNTTPTQLIGAATTALSAIGGALLAFGVVNQQTWAGITGVVTALIPLLQKQQTKVMVMHLVNKKTVGNALTGSVKKVSIIIAFIGLAFVAHSQSVFQPLHKPEKKLGVIVSPFDSIAAGQSYTGFRFQGPVVLYGTSFKTLSQSTVYTFMNISFQKATFDQPSSKYYTNWAVAVGGGVGGQFAPTSVSAVTALDAALSTQRIGKTNLPFLVTVAFIYNLTLKQGMPAVGPGIPLNN